MKIHYRHEWNVSTAEARKLQEQLSHEIRLDREFNFNHIKIVAAADVSFNRFGRFLYGAVVFLTFPDLDVISILTGEAEAGFPYIPGYLSFREAPVILQLFEKATIIPDVIICDGQGIAHPRGFGLASHVGAFLQLPTIGCAKSVLVGDYDEPEKERGSKSDLVYKGETVGVALRTRDSVKPVFVSPGNHITMNAAVEVVMQCAPRYRIPEPVRAAHNAVNDFRRRKKAPAVESGSSN